MQEQAITPFANANPLVRYEIEFVSSTPLLGIAGSFPASAVHAGISAQLADEIHWESHVNKADKLDYIVAVSSGVIAGLVDVFYVDEFSLDRASVWGKEQIERIVMKVARIEGYQGDSLQGAIRMLEKNHPFAADGAANPFGGGLQHHLRDFSHHFSIGGLFFSILTQFTGLAVGTDTAGALLVVPIPEAHRQHIGKNFQEKIVYGVIGWFFHMVSDMAGSSGSLAGGTGIPGPLVSFMKEVSALPFFKDANGDEFGFRKWVSKLFNGTLLADHDETGSIIKDTQRRFDLRTEIGILGEVGRQAIPVIINQCIVRGFYFCRRLLAEISDLDVRSVADLGRIAPEDVLPWGTPAMRRMITVSSGVFMGVDFADAAVRAIHSKSAVTFFLRINYVGVATFVVACVVDARGVLADKAATEGESPEKAYERELSDLGCFTLDFQRARVMHSLMRRSVVYDIEHEKHDKRKAKKGVWLGEWSGKMAETVGLAWAANAGYFLEEDELYRVIERLSAESLDDSWLWLVALETRRFKAYEPLHGDNDKDYKGLKLTSDYLKDVFCERCGVLDAKELGKLAKAVKAMQDSLDRKMPKVAIGAVGVVVLAVTTGGFAFYFAPALAPTLAAALGASTASLSGAALTSASLAFLGGGALAAGGAGIAGGTMLIAGGGALIGAVGGSGVSAATAMALASGESRVLEECAKLVTFCEEVLLVRCGDYAAVTEIHASLNRRVVEMEAEVESVRRSIKETVSRTKGEKPKKNEMTPKQMLKVLERSCEYLRRADKRLVKELAKAGVGQRQLAASGV